MDSHRGRKEMTGFEKHTDKELLNECWLCIGDLLEELANAYAEERPKACALLAEITKRI